MNIHRHIRLLAYFLVSLALSACSKPVEKFIGSWSNEWMGGKLMLNISRDGDNFIVKEILPESGAAFAVNSARYESGYLIVNDNRALGKISYIASDDSIQPLDTVIPRPAYRRITK